MLEPDFLEQEDKRDGDTTTLYSDHKSSKWWTQVSVVTEFMGEGGLTLASNGCYFKSFKIEQVWI